jgi:hypothetical protein
MPLVRRVIGTRKGMTQLVLVLKDHESALATAAPRRPVAYWKFRGAIATRRIATFRYAASDARTLATLSARCRADVTGEAAGQALACWATSPCCRMRMALPNGSRTPMSVP